MATPITTQLITGSGVKDVFVAENRYALVTTSGGVEVIDLFKGRVISSGTLPSEPVCIATPGPSNFGRLYVGTTTGGIYDMLYTRVRNVDSDFSGYLVQRFTTVSTPPISDNQINDLDARTGRLLVGTNTGVDFIADDVEYATRPLSGGSKAVRLTTSGGYWTTESGTFDGAVEVNYDLLSTTGTNIIDVDFEYTALSTPALPVEPPLDLTVSEVAGQLITVGVATSGGPLVFEEVPGNEAAASNKVLGPAPVIGVDFKPGAYYTSGCLYTATTGVVQVFDLSVDETTAFHTPESGTRGIVVVTGINTVIRTTDAGICPI
jgi:hypothetical protein